MNVHLVLIYGECFYILHVFFVTSHQARNLFYIKKYSIAFSKQTPQIKQLLVSHMFSTNVAKIIKTIHLKTRIFFRAINKRKHY